jgi:hypothetical protein
MSARDEACIHIVSCSGLKAVLRPHTMCPKQTRAARRRSRGLVPDIRQRQPHTLYAAANLELPTSFICSSLSCLAACAPPAPAVLVAQAARVLHLLPWRTKALTREPSPAECVLVCVPWGAARWRGRARALLQWHSCVPFMTQRHNWRFNLDSSSTHEVALAIKADVQRRAVPFEPVLATQPDTKGCPVHSPANTLTHCAPQQTGHPGS